MNLSPSSEPRSPRILVTTDFSAESEAAVDYAVILARSLGAEVEVLHVWDLRANGGLSGRAVVMSPEPPPEMTGYDVAGADGLKIRGRLEFGEVCETILRVLDSEDFDLVVMGVHERARLAHFFGRRTTAKVRAKAPCPLLTVKPGERPLVGRTPDSSPSVAPPPTSEPRLAVPSVPPPPPSPASGVVPAAPSSDAILADGADRPSDPTSTERPSRPSWPPMVAFPLASPH